MTKGTFYSKIKTFIALFLIAVLAACACGLFAACGDDQSETDTSETSYTYSETDTDIISNSDFAYGTYNKTEGNFPITSPTGWTRSSDNSAASSNVNSGVISTADTAWDKLFDTLYSDSDFAAYFNYKHKDAAIAAIRTEKGDEEYAPSTDELKAYYKTLFVNPDTPDGAADAYVYMLNNYTTSNYNFNSTAQRIRSSSTVTVKKGETYKISVSVKTLNVTGDGANIRLTNVVNGSTQAEYRISGIKDTEWTEYTVYFTAHEDYDCTFTVSLGLGYGKGDSNATERYSEGTVFFDGVTVTKDIEEIPATERQDVVKFTSADPVEIVIAGENQNHAFAYSMNYDANDVIEGYFAPVAIDASLTAERTSVNINGVQPAGAELPADALTFADGAATLSLEDYSAVTLTLKNGNANFTVNAESYALISFKIGNRLNKLSSTDVTVTVIDVLGDNSEKRSATTFSEVSEDLVAASILVKNNFTDINREFYIKIFVGPTDIASVTAASELAKGTLVIQDVKVAQGFISADKYENDSDDAEYKLFNSLSSGANATVVLYAGFNADMHNHGDESATYSLTPAKGSVGRILTNVSDVSGYYGIVANHIYITGSADGQDLETMVNVRSAFAADGYAGLINTAYIEEYQDKANLKALLNGLYEDEDIQPLIIYNNFDDNAANHYGFVGEKKTISASGYGKVTLKVKVSDGATAYIYLVDVSGEEKKILTFDGREFVLTVDENSEKGEDGWTEVTFYVATGATAKDFRVEVWNGGRDGAEQTASKGYVAVNEITVQTSGAFTEPAIAEVSSTDNPIYNMFTNPNKLEDGEELLSYTRELTDTEKQFNKEYPDQAVSYQATYIWAKNDTAIYAVYNTVDPVIADPYDSIEQPEESSGCASDADPSTFWLSFSSIALAAVIVLALIALIVKTVAKKHKANKSDVKAQYKVKSRTETHKAIRKAQAKKDAENAAKLKAEETPAETVEDKTEDVTADAEQASAGADEENPEDKTTIETDYVYGDVQDFGDMTLETEDKPEGDAEKPADAENGENK